MVRRYYNLPSLTMLAAFESCARHMSIKLASSELNVTPGAVSRQIRGLEDEAGTPLFHRDKEGMHLTPEGEELYAVLARGFSQASEAFDRIRTGRAQSSVTLACSTAFGSLWLMPRIGAFWRAHPEIAINHMISDVANDYRRAEIDLRIRYGAGAWPDEMATRLFGDRIFPVCGPGYFKAHSRTPGERIAELDLLHVAGVDPEWTNWEEFLRRAGITHGPIVGRRFNNFSVLMQAAMDDQGVALGWEHLVAPMLLDRRLKKLTKLGIDAPGAYYLTWNQNRALSPAAETLKDWLIETAAAAA
ncbi:MAG: LysR substrate-binding domain-containing protein [Rhodospirillales bacterium]